MEKKQKRGILKPPKNVRGFHFYEENLSFPIVIFECDDKDKARLSYLNSRVHSTETLCKWCKQNGLQYQIMYPLYWPLAVRHPYKLWKYLLLVWRLRHLDSKKR